MFDSIPFPNYRNLSFLQNPSKDPIAASQHESARGERKKIIEETENAMRSSETALKKYSILNQLPSEIRSLVDDFKTSPDSAQKALVLTSLGFSAKETGYEGWLIQKCADLYAGHFNNIRCQGNLFANQTDLPFVAEKNVRELSDNATAHQAAKTIAALPSGESYAMPGGWKAYPRGHAMVYRFVCTSNTVQGSSYDVYIYHAAQGAEDIQGGFYGLQRKCRPCMLLKDVPFEELFFCKKGETINPIIFEKLLALQTTTQKWQLTDVLACFFHCSHRLQVSEQLQKANLFISMQRSGNCTVKSINCMLLDLIGDYGAYKRISLDIRFFTLLAFYTHISESFISPKPIHIFQLKQASANFLNILNTHFLNKNIGISEEQYQTACATILEIHNACQKWEGINKDSWKDLEAGGQYHDQDVNQKRLQFAETKLKELLTPSSKPPTKNSPLSPDPHLGKGSTWENLQNVLFTLAHLMKELRQRGRPQDLVFQTEATLKNLAHLKTIPSSIPPKLAQTIQNNLLDIQDDYNNAALTWLRDLTFPSVQNTAMEFLILSYRLAERADPHQVIGKFSVDIRFFMQSARNDPLFACQDLALLKQRADLESFFSEKRSGVLWASAEVSQEDAFLEGKTPEGALYLEYCNKSHLISQQLITCVNSDNYNSKPQPHPMDGAFMCYQRMRYMIDIDPLKFVYHLKRAHILTQELFVDKNDTSSNTYSTSGWYCVGRNFTFYTPRKDWSHCDKHDSYKRDFSPQEELKAYASHSQSEHDVTKLTSENALILTQSSEDQPAILPFYLGLAEPTVQTTLLLQACASHLSELSDPKFRATLLHMLIKNVEVKGHMVSPFILSLEDAHALKKFELLLQKGKRCFVDGMPENKPLLLEMLFLIRIYARACHVMHDLHPDWQPSEQSESLIMESIAFLKKTRSRLDDSPQNEELKKETRLAEVGLYLSLSWNRMDSPLQADYFIEMIRMKKELPALMSSSDPTFVRECKRRYFYAVPNMVKFFTDQPKKLQDFGNACLCKFLGGEERKLFWKLDNSCLTTTDPSEHWEIDLAESSLKNSSGTLSESYKELATTSPHFNRLFKDRRYRLKIFGEETDNQEIFFHSPVWGNIKIQGKGNGVSIQRYFQNKWYTYIPHLPPIKVALFLNDALTADHALWVDLDNPTDIRFCDLQTSAPLYHMNPEGYIIHDKTGKIFYTIHSSSNTPWKNFEEDDRITGWLYPSLKEKYNPRGFLELSRFCNAEDRVPLNFTWDNSKHQWIYNANPAFHVQEVSNISLTCSMNRFLILTDQEGTRQKALIPHGEKVESAGYRTSSSIILPSSSDKGATPIDDQKGRLIFYEYDVSLEGKPIPQSLESRIYLALLYLAQKSYGEAAAVIKAISFSETLSKNAIEMIESSLLSSGQFKDFSPNAAAVHLLLYYTAKKLFYIPSTKTKEAIKETLKNDLETYFYGLNSLEHAVTFSLEVELELLAFLEVDSVNSSCLYNRRSQLNQSLFEYTPILTESTFPTEYIFVNPTTKFFEKKKLEDGLIDDEYLKQVMSLFLKHDLFVKYYTILKTQGARSPAGQGVLYHLLFLQKEKSTLFNDHQIMILYLVAKLSEEAPHFPETLTNITIESWYEALKKLYETKIHPNRLTSAPAFEFPDTPKSPPQKIPLPPSPKKPKKHSILEESAFLASGMQDIRFFAWQQTYLEERGAIDNQLASSPPITTSRSDELYKIAIQENRKHYLKDCAIAHDKQRRKRIWKKNLTKAEYLSFIEEMKAECKRAEGNELLLKKEMQPLMRRQPTENLLSFAIHQAEWIGKNGQTPPLEAFLRAACQPNSSEALCKLNPHLSDPEAKQLRNLCIELMVEVTHRCHLERIYLPLEKWLSDGNKSHFEQAQIAMVEERHYDPRVTFFPLLFEYFSEVRVREKQVAVINDVCNTIFSPTAKSLQSRAFQLIMAGGKTNVILSMLVELISESGSVPCILSHHSQFASAKGSFQALQSKRFGKDLVILDFSMDELSRVDILDLIDQKLKEAKRKKWPVLMKSTFPVLVELKFILEGQRLNAISQEDALEKHATYLEKLRQINLFLRQETISLYDECDISLSILTDVNIPQGRPKNIAEERASLVKALYSLCIEGELTELIGLDKNMQAEKFSEKLFTEKVVPIIADHVFSYPALFLSTHQTHKSAFIRYVTDQIPYEDQKLADSLAKNQTIDINSLPQINRENIQFLVELERRYRSPNRYEQESCQLIALVRKMSRKVLKVAFTRTHNRNYGRDPDHDDGRVSPFLGVSSRAITKFGDPYLALAYQFQAALNVPIAKGEIQFLAKKMHEAAIYYASKEKTAFLETAEAKQFKELTGVSLMEIAEEEGLERAYQWLNDPQHLQRRLEFEAEVAPFHVHYYTQKVSSNPINAVSQSKQSVACSGTLWNHSTYHPRITTHKDEGTEGAILNLLALREKEYAKNGLEFIHEVYSLEIQSFLTLIRQNPNKQRIRAIIDGGGLLRDYTNEQIAQTLKTFLKEELAQGGPSVKVIIYLHQSSPKEIQNGFPKETFAILKIEEEGFHPIILKNTTKEEIARHGLNKDEIFFLFDELRATGTDIELADDAIFLLTTDHKMTIRTALQSLLRARKLFEEQQAELVVLSQTRREMTNEGKTFADLRATWEVNEAILLKDQKDQARPAQIENIGRSALVEILLAQKPDKKSYKKIFDDYEKCLITTCQDDLYLQERIKSIEPAGPILRQYANGMLERYVMDTNKSLEEDVNQLLEIFHEQISPDEKMLNDPSKASTETEILLEQEDQVQIELVDLNQEVEMNQELQREWQSYQFKNNCLPYLETPWTITNDQSIYSQIESSLLTVPVMLACTNFNPPIPKKVQEYAKGFPSFLKMTRNFYQVSTENLPLLHHHAKEAKFVLIVKNHSKEWQFILISEKDAAFFKQWLAQHPSTDLFLIDTGGIPEVNTENFLSQPEGFSETLIQGLCYVNLFNGNAEYLEEHAKVAKPLFQDHQEALAEFMILKVLSLKGKNGLSQLPSSKVFDFSKIELPKQKGGILFSARRQEIAKRYQQIRKLGPTEIAQLSPEDVGEIAPHQVQWLRTKDQLNQLPDHLMNELLPSQIEKGFFPDRKIHLFTKPELIQALQNPKDWMNLEAHQLGLISDQQKAFLKGKAYQKARKNGFENIKSKYFQFFDTKEDIEQIPPAHIFKIPTHTWLLIPNEKIQRFQENDTLDKSIVQRFTNDQLTVLDARYASSLSNPQIRRLTKEHTHLIQALHGNEKLSLLSDEALQEISPKQLSFIDEKSFQRIDNFSLLMAAPDPCIGYFSDQQKKQFKEALIDETVRDQLTETTLPLAIKLDPQIIPLLKQAQVSILPDHAINDLSPEQIQNNYLTPAKFHLLYNQELIQALHNPEDFFNLSDAQLRLLSEPQLELFKKLLRDRASSEGILSIHERHLKYFDLTPEEIATLQPPVPPPVDTSKDLQASNLTHEITEEPVPTLNQKKVQITKAETPSKCKLISSIVLSILAFLIGTTALLVGCFALLGAKLTFGPQFIIQAYETIQNSSFAPYILVAGGGLIYLGLVVFAVWNCTRKENLSGEQRRE